MLTAMQSKATAEALYCKRLLVKVQPHLQYKPQGKKRGWREDEAWHHVAE